MSNPVTHSIPTLAQVAERLPEIEGLSPKRCRDLVSALKRVARLTGRPLAALPAEPEVLAGLLATVHPAAHGLTAKSVTNVRYDLLAALRAVGLAERNRVRLDALPPEWAALYEALPSRRETAGLSRLIRWAAEAQMAPAQIDDAVIAKFMDHVRANSLVAKPGDLHRRLTKIWNECAERVAGWPAQRLSVPDNRAPALHLPFAAYPETLEAEVEAYLAWAGDPDPFADGARERALKPSTLRQQREHLRLAASHLHRSGTPLEAIDGLSVLLEPEAFKAILRSLHRHAGQQATEQNRQIALTLVQIADGFLHLSDDRVATLKALRGKLPQRAPQVAAKNLEVLRALDDPQTLARLLHLPDTLWRQAVHASPPDARAAVKAQIALAVELQLVCQLRPANLTSLAFDEQLLRPGGPTACYHLHIDGAATKNGKAIERPLPRRLTQMLDLYRARYLPLLDKAGSGRLFVAQGGRPKAQATLAQQMTEAAERHVGHHITPHVYRHIGAKLVLAENPGAYQLVSEMLTHSSAKTAPIFYAPFDANRAAQHYDRLLQTRRSALAERAGGRRQRRRVA